MVAFTHQQPADALPLDNRRLAERLDEVADRLEAAEHNPYRVRAYRLAAETVRRLDRPVAEVLDTEGTKGLRALPGIGTNLARALELLVRTGELPLLNDLRGRADPEALLATVAGIGPQLAHRITERLGVHTLEELESSAYDGRLRDVPGLGEKRLRNIRETLAGRLGRRPAARVPHPDEPAVGELLALDEVYRDKAERGLLRRIAPRRFNPQGEAWLPVFRRRRGGREFRVLYSNTALAHQQGKTRDWVVIYCEQDGRRSQWTVVTANSGPLRGRRLVRGRERECEQFYADAAPPHAPSTGPAEAS